LKGFLIEVEARNFNDFCPPLICKSPLKDEIFDISDFHDFYTIKSLWMDDFGVKILIKGKGAMKKIWNLLQMAQ
jgi:hypothetical protein